MCMNLRQHTKKGSRISTLRNVFSFAFSFYSFFLVRKSLLPLFAQDVCESESGNSEEELFSLLILDSFL
jgi:hypothetical protein